MRPTEENPCATDIHAHICALVASQLLLAACHFRRRKRCTSSPSSCPRISEQQQNISTQQTTVATSSPALSPPPPCGGIVHSLGRTLSPPTPKPLGNQLPPLTALLSRFTALFPACCVAPGSVLRERAPGQQGGGGRRERSAARVVNWL